MRRVVVTGIGVLSALGVGLEATGQAFMAGACAIGPNTQFDGTGFGQPLAGLVPPFDVRSAFRTPKALKLCDRRTRLAVAASAQALAHAGLASAEELVLEGLGVILGTSGSDLGVPDVVRAVDGMDPRDTTDIARFGARVLDRLNPLWLLVNLPNMASAHVAIQFGARGPNSTLMTGDAAGLQAIGEAADLVRAGEAEIMLAGAADTSVMPFACAAEAHASGWPEGFVPAEAAVMLVLETREHARARGVPMLAEIVAFDCARREAMARSAVRVECAASGQGRGAAAHRVVDATPLAGYPYAAAAPLSLACALAGNGWGRVVAEAHDRGGAVVTLELARQAPSRSTQCEYLGRAVGTRVPSEAVPAGGRR